MFFNATYHWRDVKMTTYRVLSIDAWGNQEDGYDWNSWDEVAEFDGDIDNNREVLEFFTYVVNDITFFYTDDDGYNIVLYEKDTDMPCYAIEYGVYL